jgi:flagellar biosynthetic protein FliP
MAAAMYLPFVLFLVPYYLGWVSGMTVMMGGHILMVPLMLAAMVWRYNDYAHHGHHGHH